jgi:hypothetical protein
MCIVEPKYCPEFWLEINEQILRIIGIPAENRTEHRAAQVQSVTATLICSVVKFYISQWTPGRPEICVLLTAILFKLRLGLPRYFLRQVERMRLTHTSLYS